MEIKVDKDKCFGCGQCFYNYDELFECDDDGLAKAKVNEVSDEFKDDALDAANGCPANAINVKTAN